MLLVVVRLLEACLKVSLELYRTLPGFSERIDLECRVGVEGEVIGLIAKECIFAECVPFEILVVLSSCS